MPENDGRSSAFAPAAGVESTGGVTAVGPVLGRRPAWVRYATAAALVGTGAWVRIALVPWIGTDSPLLALLPGILATGYLAGLGPALFACVLSGVAATVFFTHFPAGQHGMAWGAHTALFGGVGIAISLLIHYMQRDLVGRMRTEADLRTALSRLRGREQRLKLATDVAELGIFVWDMKGNRILSESTRNLAMFGRTPDDQPLTYEEFLERFVHPEDRGQFDTHLNEALKTSRPLRLLARIRPHDSLEWRWIEIAATFESETGSQAHLVGVLRDITERRQSEEALREREGMLDLIYNNSSDCLYLIEVDGSGVFRVVSANATFLRICGYTHEQVEGQPMENVIAAENHELVRSKYEEVLATGRPVQYFEEAHLPAGLRYGEITLIPIHSAQGSVSHILGAIKDVTTHRRAEQSLADADRRKDEFLAMLAHELRNPLAPIRTIAHVLSRDGVDAATVRRSGELLQRQAAHLARMVDDLLDVARITRGTIDLKRHTLGLDRIIDRAMETVQPLVTLKRQTISVTPATVPLFVKADEVRLVQVFGNLLTNAAKYSPERTMISVDIAQEDDLVRVAVRDCGIGLDPQLLPHVFDLFMQADRSLDRSQGGLGIGLTVVKHLVELHGGSVEAHSAGPDRGSEFVVKLPLALSKDALGADEPQRDGVSSRSFRVLIVEDNADAAETLATLLSMHGHRVEVAPNGLEALEKLETSRSDVVLLDIGLPGMDGYVVAQCIRERHATAPMRLYALTGYGRDEDRSLARSSGFDGHLTKPVDPTLLLAIVAGEVAATDRQGDPVSGLHPLR